MFLKLTDLYAKTHQVSKNWNTFFQNFSHLWFTARSTNNNHQPHWFPTKRTFLLKFIGSRVNNPRPSTALVSNYIKSWVGKTWVSGFFEKMEICFYLLKFSHLLQTPSIDRVRFHLKRKERGRSFFRKFGNKKNTLWKFSHFYFFFGRPTNHVHPFIDFQKGLISSSIYFGKVTT